MHFKVLCKLRTSLFWVLKSTISWLPTYAAAGCKSEQRHISCLKLFIIQCSHTLGSSGLPSPSCSGLSEIRLLHAEKGGLDRDLVPVSYPEMSYWIMYSSLIPEPHLHGTLFARTPGRQEVQHRHAHTYTHTRMQADWNGSASPNSHHWHCYALKRKAKSLKIPLHNVCSIVYKSPSLFTSLIQSQSV